MTIRITLSGCDTARYGDTVVTTTRGGPINKLARLLVDAGHDGTELVEVYRGDTPCFLPMNLCSWAHWTISEGDHGIKRLKYVPMPDGLHRPSP